MSPLHLPCYYSRHFIKPFEDGSLVGNKTRLWFFAAFSGDGTMGALSGLQEGISAWLLPRQAEPGGMDEF